MSSSGAAGRVVLAGFGVVGATGSGEEALTAAFERGELPLTEVDRSAGYHRESGARHAALVSPGALEGWIPPRQARRMSPPSRFAVAAGRQAIQRAGEDAGFDLDHEMGIVSSTSFGPSSYTEELLRQIFLDQPTAASPSLFTEAVANAPAAQIALSLKATGPNLTVTQREAGPFLALAESSRMILKGRVESAMAVAVDEVNPLLHAALDRYGVLAGSRGGDEVPRPFDRRRRGSVIGEGATAFLLESEARLRARGLRPGGDLWWLRGHVAGFDPRAPRTSWGQDPEPLARALVLGLERLGLEPAHFTGGEGAVVCGARGSARGDAAEAAVLREVFGPGAMPPVVAAQAYTGEHGGGLLAGVARLLTGGSFASPPGLAEADPDCAVVPFGDGNLAPRRVLAGALAVGGAAAWTVFEKLET
ncbi:MAG: beta-ketoacyl synthase N-terminal-like domain-containing protein [Acidobacteriota bacterium]